MKLIIVDHIQQTRNWVNTEKPKTYNHSMMEGVEDNEAESKFMFIMRQGDWTVRLRGMEISEWWSRSHTQLTTEETALLNSLVRP